MDTSTSLITGIMAVYSFSSDPTDLRRMNIIGRMSAFSEYENSIGTQKVSRVTSLTDD